MTDSDAAYFPSDGGGLYLEGRHIYEEVQLKYPIVWVG
jgi:hypothetical protein